MKGGGVRGKGGDMDGRGRGDGWRRGGCEGVGARGWGGAGQGKGLLSEVRATATILSECRAGRLGLRTHTRPAPPVVQRRLAVPPCLFWLQTLRSACRSVPQACPCPNSSLPRKPLPSSAGPGGPNGWDCGLDDFGIAGDRRGARRRPNGLAWRRLTD